MADNRIDPRKRFVPRFLPWLLAAAALAFYWSTLNRWVSLLNITPIAKISGWTWQPEVFSPVLFAATYPFRWLHTAQIPLALNFFSAVCAALTLGLLARSVAILPHDRTEAERERERSDFSFLTLWSAWLPPVLAVAACGLQFTFWEHATNFTGETLDLLLFAFIIWSLLEYRLDERTWRLFLAAFVYGAAMADNWAMIGFLPIFIGAIIWIRGFGFFNTRFLSRMVFCGLAGMLFYLLLPALAASSGHDSISFWTVLKYNLAQQWDVVKMIFDGDKRRIIGILSLTSLLPLFVMAIRWGESFGDSSRLGTALATFMFHVFHAIILFACVWVTFDPPFSPRYQAFGMPALTFYYLVALNVGYYSGYFLLVFGKDAGGRSQRPQPSPWRFLKLPVVAGVFALAALTAIGLIYKNAPQIKEANGDTLQKYAALVEEKLPRAGGVLLCDTENQGVDNPTRLFITLAALARDGRARDFLPLDTFALDWPAYHRFLHRKFPEKWPQTVGDKEMNMLNPHGLAAIVNLLSKSNAVYYLQPSFGYYFEQFYLEPHGLIYRLKPLPEDTLVPPKSDEEQIAENEKFWSGAEVSVFPAIEQQVTPPETNATQNFAANFAEHAFGRLHIRREQNPDAIAVANFYSRSLDFWGVQLQRAGELEKAAARFETAQKLNPDNLAAQVNLKFNETLRAGRAAPVDLSKTTPDQIGNWNDVINADGPFDEPSFCFQNGIYMAQDTYFRQAIASFNRVRELAPDNLAARFWLGQLYFLQHLPDQALDALHDPLTEPEKFGLGPTNSTELNILAAADYFLETNHMRATELIDLEISRHPTDNDLLTAAAQFYVMHGLYTNALAVIEHKLKTSPDDLPWLYSRGFVLMQMKNYDAAAAAFTRVLAVQTNNFDALFNRAVARLESGNLDDARADYLRLQKNFTNSFQVAYGLGEIAWRKQETNEAVRNYEIYLANASTNTAEAQTVRERLRELKK
jgi:tetratricopeptide (TPR) repeat protein